MIYLSRTVMPAKAGIHGFHSCHKVGKRSVTHHSQWNLTPSLRVGVANEAIQNQTAKPTKPAGASLNNILAVVSTIYQSGSGLLRWRLQRARNDGFKYVVSLTDHRALLKAVKATATRRATRGLDRFSHRALLNTAGTKKRPFQPNQETGFKSQ